MKAEDWNKISQVMREIEEGDDILFTDGRKTFKLIRLHDDTRR